MGFRKLFSLNIFIGGMIATLSTPAFAVEYAAITLTILVLLVFLLLPLGILKRLQFINCYLLKSKGRNSFHI